MSVHSEYVAALKDANLMPVSPKRHFGKEGEVYVRGDGDAFVVWAYDDYGILWRGSPRNLFGIDMSLRPELFTVYTSRSLI